MPQTWQLGKFFSVDEMTMGFKGNHRDKKGLLTRQKVMDFSVMHCAKMGILFKFGCEMILLQKNILPKVFLLFIQESWVYLTQ